MREGNNNEMKLSFKKLDKSLHFQHFDEDMKKMQMKMNEWLRT